MGRAKKALKSRQVRMEERLEELLLVSAASLQPEPIPFDAKVVLLGSPSLFEPLWEADEDFRELRARSASRALLRACPEQGGCRRQRRRRGCKPPLRREIHPLLARPSRARDASDTWIAHPAGRDPTTEAAMTLHFVMGALFMLWHLVRCLENDERDREATRPSRAASRITT